MNEQEFQSKVAELMGEITTLPPTERKKLEKLADETRQRHERLRATVSSLQESLDYLRLSISIWSSTWKRPAGRTATFARCWRRRPAGTSRCDTNGGAKGLRAARQNGLGSY